MIEFSLSDCLTFSSIEMNEFELNSRVRKRKVQVLQGAGISVQIYNRIKILTDSNRRRLKVNIFVFGHSYTHWDYIV